MKMWSKTGTIIRSWRNSTLQQCKIKLIGSVFTLLLKKWMKSFTIASLKKSKRRELANFRTIWEPKKRWGYRRSKRRRNRGLSKYSIVCYMLTKRSLMSNQFMSKGSMLRSRILLTRGILRTGHDMMAVKAMETLSKDFPHIN